MSRFNHKIGGHRPIFYTDQPYYLKHMPGNPFFGSEHDGVSVGFRQGFIFKPIHWLYRFRHNVTPRGGLPLYLRNPPGKDVHWLEVSTIEKFRLRATSDEGFPHMLALLFALSFTAWQFFRYAVFHPDLSLINFMMPPLKHMTQVTRMDEKHPMDRPVFRWFQRAPEFYGYDGYREMIKMGVIANDPYIEYMKKAGKERDLIGYTKDRGWGEGGRGKITHLLSEQRVKERKKEYR